MPMPRTRLSADDAIDLQLHTIYSDGQWEPEPLFAHLAAAGFRVVSITDHDTLEHVDELCALGARVGVHVVPGVEVTTTWRGYPAHLLCYAERFTGDALAAIIRRTERAQYENSLAVHTELARRGFRFPETDAVLAAQGGQAMRRIDNARLLMEHRYAADIEAAIALIREAGYRQILAPLAEAAAAAHASGAVTVLAHPGRSNIEIHRFDPPQVEEMLGEIALDGIEVCYPTHAEEQVAAYDALAQRRGLLTGAGSDSHGPKQRLPVAYPARVAAALLERCGVVVG